MYASVRPTHIHMPKSFPFFFIFAEVSVHYKYGLPVITLTLPSRKERCQFTIKPMLTTVGTFLKDIKREDNAIEKVEVFTTGTNADISLKIKVVLTFPRYCKI